MTQHGGTTPRGAYPLAGLLLVLYGLVPVAWVVYSLVVTEAPIGDFLEQLVNPVSHTYSVRALTPYEWAFAVALIVTGVCAIARRTAARGGALLLSIMLLGLSIREGVGLLDAAYRESFSHGDEGSWILATRVAGFVVAVMVIAAVLRPSDGAVRRTVDSRRFLIAGVAMLLAGAGKLAWILYSNARFGDFGAYLRDLVDASGFGPASMISSITFYDAALTVALLVVGALAVRQRRVARGAALVLSGVILYVLGYLLIGLISHAGETLPLPELGTALFWISSAVPVAVAVLVLPLMALARSDDEPPALDPAGFAPLPGDVGQQHSGGH